MTGFMRRPRLRSLLKDVHDSGEHFEVLPKIRTLSCDGSDASWETRADLLRGLEGDDPRSRYCERRQLM